jgi:hypothetical protein
MPTSTLRRSHSAATAARAFTELLGVLIEGDFRGWDPYDALSSPLLRRLGVTPSARQALVQALRRSPVNLRPLLAVRRQAHLKGLALAASACAAAGRSGHAAGLAARVLALSMATDAGIAWGYNFDVQTRWGYYRAGQPNAVATVFAAHALLDVAELTGQPEFDEAARAAVSFCHAELLADCGGDRFFAYYRGASAPIHNANLLVAGLIARTGSEAAMSAAGDAIAYTLARQRADGSWPYGDGTSVGWVDGYHSAYVLDDLRRWHRATGDEATRAALETGLRYYLDRLIDRDGAARATSEARFPVDIHACATAITVLSRLRDVDDDALPAAERVLRWTLAHMRRPDGRFAYQRHRRYQNSVPYVRWNDCHMLLALASYADAAGCG